MTIRGYGRLEDDRYLARFGRGADYGVELLVNGGFETAGAGGADVFAGWVETASDGSIVDELTLVQSGGHALKLVNGTTGLVNVVQQVTAVPQRTYALSFWTRGDGVKSLRYVIGDTTHSGQIVPTTSTGIIGTTYTKVTVPFVTPTGCIQVGIYFYCCSGSGSVYVDNASLRLVTF